MKTLTPEQRREGFVRLIGMHKDGHLWSFHAGISYAEMVFGEEPKVPFIRLTDEEILEIVGPYKAVGGYTRMLFDTIQDKLEEKNNE